MSFVVEEVKLIKTINLKFGSSGFGATSWLACIKQATERLKRILEILLLCQYSHAGSILSCLECTELLEIISQCFGLFIYASISIAVILCSFENIAVCE